MHVDLYTGLWLGWGAAFVVIEGSAILGKKKGRTLSETVWRWFAVKQSWTWKRYVLLAFLGWLLTHLVFGVLPG